MKIDIDHDTMIIIKDFSGSAGFTALALLFGYNPLATFLISFALGLYLILKEYESSMDEMMMVEIMAWLFGTGFTLTIYLELFSRYGELVTIF